MGWWTRWRRRLMRSVENPVRTADVIIDTKEPITASGDCSRAERQCGDDGTAAVVRRQTWARPHRGTARCSPSRRCSRHCSRRSPPRRPAGRGRLAAWATRVSRIVRRCGALVLTRWPGLAASRAPTPTGRLAGRSSPAAATLSAIRSSMSDKYAFVVQGRFVTGRGRAWRFVARDAGALDALARLPGADGHARRP